jgi:hypothetical protein
VLPLASGIMRPFSVYPYPLPGGLALYSLACISSSKFRAGLKYPQAVNLRDNLAISLPRDNVWRAMTDVQWVTAMAPPGGGRAFVSSRLLRQFSTLACVQVRGLHCRGPPGGAPWNLAACAYTASSPDSFTPANARCPLHAPYLQASDDTLSHIFGSILSWHLSKRGFPSSAALLAAPLVAATLDLYRAAAGKLLPTPAKSHYLFNLRDFARVVQAGPPGGVGGLDRLPHFLCA